MHTLFGITLVLYWHYKVRKSKGSEFDSKGSELSNIRLERAGEEVWHYKARKARSLASYGSKRSELGIIWLERLEV